MTPPELSEGIQVLAAVHVLTCPLLALAGLWSARRRDRRYNDYGFDRDARL